MSSELFIAVLTGLCVICGAMLTFILNGIANSLKEMNENVKVLNDKMTVIVNRVDSHEGRIASLESPKNRR